MSDHTMALVPLESWCYASPELRACGLSIDIGLFAEALIYYDCVAVIPTNQPQFADFIRWFAEQGCFDDLLTLFNDGVLKVYEYSFVTTAVEKEGVYSIWNIQDSIQSLQNTFEQRYLYHPSVEAVLPHKARQRRKVYNALQGNVFEVKADEFGSAVDNARKDFENPFRNQLIVQAFVDELYRFKQMGRAPEISTSILTSDDGTRNNITWNVNFNKLSEYAGKELNFHKGTPFTAGAHSNRLIWSASKLGCDLYLPRPMSLLVGDKLYESTETIVKAGQLIEQLERTVEFPDIRGLVNSGSMKLADILSVRKKAKKFREWLQRESERDRDAIVAYHYEVARQSGFASAGRRALSIFGVVGGGALGGAIGNVFMGPIGGAISGVAGTALSYLVDIAASYGTKWKPVIFGEWLRERVEKNIREGRQRLNAKPSHPQDG
ncbi:MAG TPA: hypothetical protein PLW73_01920 [Methanoregulaceae archaeon]|nr:hypothetical protein [Methanoregulaceae archaeon]